MYTLNMVSYLSVSGKAPMLGTRMHVHNHTYFYLVNLL
jgi:hypothetical protein